MHPVSLVALAIRRLRSRPGLTALSLLGVVLSVGIVACIPIFAQSVSFLVLRDELDGLSRATRRPPMAIRFAFVSSAEQPLALAGAYQMAEIVAREVGQRVGLPVRQVVAQVQSPKMVMYPPAGDPRYPKGDTSLALVSLTWLSQVSDHLTIVEGEPYGAVPPGDRVPVWVHEALADKLGLFAGDDYELHDVFRGQVVHIRIAGVWVPRDRAHEYWVDDPEALSHDLLVTREVYETAVQPRFPQRTGSDRWYVVLDDSRLSVAGAEAAARGLEAASNVIFTRLPGRVTGLDYSPLEPLRRYVQRRATLSVLLVGFSLPSIGLLFYFLTLISSVTVQYQREETAIVASRGGSTVLILGLAILEALLLVGLGAIPGIALGYGLARLMGYSLSFLTFVGRPPLPVSLGGIDWRLVGGAVLVLVAARLLPTLRAARVSIVSHLQTRSRQVPLRGLLKLAVDLLLILISTYAYFQLRRRGTIGILSWDPGSDPFRDPLLLVAPSLFVFTASLIAAHLFPVIMRPIDSLGGRLSSFAAYMGIRHLRRQSGQYASALFLVVICLSLGAFYSSMGLSLDRWLRDRVYYRIGADFTFRQFLKKPAEGAAVIAEAQKEGGWLLPATVYLSIPGVKRATRVGDYQAALRMGRFTSSWSRILGVDRLDFPQVAYFRDDFAPVPLGELMNRLGMHHDGLLVSQKFLQDNQMVEGQPLRLDIKLEGQTRYEMDFVVAGTFDYFPTVVPDEQGTVMDLFVANLDYIFDQIGAIYMHSIWLRTDPTLGRDELDLALRKMKVDPAFSLVDTRNLVAADEDRVERVGLFGALSTGFLASSVLSAVGLLVFTFASLQGRLEQICVLRALGAQMREVLAMVGIEYAGTIAYGVLWGVVIGVVASHLFVPFFQFTSDRTAAVPPFLPAIAWGEIGWIASIFAGALLLSQLAILIRATRRDVFQVLRMGQRE